MMLNRTAKEFYTLEITTYPPVTAWEASFDGGTTWTAGLDTGDGAFQWLVAGPSADTSGAIALSSKKTSPLVRSATSSEVVVRDAPTIWLD